MRLRLIFGLIVCAFLGAGSSYAQNFTAVSGTIVDPNGLPYSNCAITAELVPAGTNPTIGGAAVGGLNRASCDVNGNFSMTLGSNAVIVPGGTQWKFTVNEQPGILPPAGFGPQSFSTVITISGASQNISVLLNVPALALARSGAAGPVAGVSAQDSGTRADGPLGVNWTQTNNGFTISSNAFLGSNPGINSAFWAANTFASYQFSQATTQTLNGTTDFLGVSVFNQPTGANFYSCVENSTTILLQKVVNGVPTTLATTASTGQINETLRLESWNGSSLVCSKNGAPVFSVVDTTFSSGSPGITISGNVARLANFWGGNNTTAGNCTTVTPITVNANVTSDQSLLSCPLRQSAIGFAIERLEVSLAGVYSTPAASTSAVTVKVLLCNVAGCGSGSVVTLVSITSSALAGVQVTNNPLSLDVTCLTIPSATLSTFEVHGNLNVGLSASQSAAQSVFADNNTAAVGPITTGVPLFLQTTIAFSVASASNSFTARALVLRMDP